MTSAALLCSRPVWHDHSPFPSPLIEDSLRGKWQRHETVARHPPIARNTCSQSAAFPGSIEGAVNARNFLAYVKQRGSRTALLLWLRTSAGRLARWLGVRSRTSLPAASPV
ncbi:MAG: hypothetical protein JO110_16360 [Acetobacteraceae bacterium]|nr:hypothetical protein [Acetobacteraceae bacterium]